MAIKRTRTAVTVMGHTSLKVKEGEKNVYKDGQPTVHATFYFAKLWKDVFSGAKQEELSEAQALKRTEAQTTFETLAMRDLVLSVNKVLGDKRISAEEYGRFWTALPKEEHMANKSADKPTSMPALKIAVLPGNSAFENIEALWKEKTEFTFPDKERTQKSNVQKMSALSAKMTPEENAGFIAAMTPEARKAMLTLLSA